MRKNSVKNTRVNAEFQREISIIIREEIKDPRIHAMTSVIDVEVTPDLKFAKVFISVLGSEEERASALEGLQSAAPFVRSLLAKRVNLRNTPHITFVLDTSIEYGITMSKKIDDLHLEKD